MPLVSYRILNLFAFLSIFILLFVAAYMQFYMSILPCPLCIIERTLFIILGLLFLGGAFYQPTKVIRRVYQGLIFIIALIGSIISARHVWLQHLPSNQAPACGPGLNFIIKNLPIAQAAKMIFTGTADCAKVAMKIFYLSIPEWSLIFFIIMLLIAAVQFARKT